MAWTPCLTCHWKMLQGGVVGAHPWSVVCVILHFLHIQLNSTRIYPKPPKPWICTSVPQYILLSWEFCLGCRLIFLWIRKSHREARLGTGLGAPSPPWVVLRVSTAEQGIMQPLPSLECLSGVSSAGYPSFLVIQSNLPLPLLLIMGKWFIFCGSN